MTDHANELRRYARKIAHPAGDVPSVMLAAADEIERLREWIHEEGERNDVCTYNILGKVCGYCECKRKKESK